MKPKDLRRLSRGDLLEMLLDLSLENDRLHKELVELREKLAQRTIAVEEGGSLAEAALKLNGVFEAAQAACEQYTENIRAREAEIEERCSRMEAEARTKADAILAQAREQREMILADAQMEAQKLVEEEESHLEALEEEQRWLLDILDGGETQ